MILEVLAGGVALVQDAGRPGRMHEGVPPGGPMVPELYRVANAAAGNPSGAAVLETYGPLKLVARGGSLVVAIDGAAREALADEPFEVPAPADWCVRYVAPRGGIDVPVVLGGRGTLAVAGLGGLGGRALRRGDRLPIGESVGSVGVLPGPVPSAVVRVLIGPDRLPEGAVELLLSATFRVGVRDRVGARLEGPPLPAGDGLGVSTPMARGAIQVPPAGGPIVLGPDHPTTGGYPVVATVIRADLGLAGGRPAGAELRFREVILDEASQAWREWLARYERG